VICSPKWLRRPVEPTTARFRISRSWRRISFSRRNRFSSAAGSSPGGRRSGSPISRSRLCDSHRVKVDKLTPRSSLISPFVRPLVRNRRTASSSNSFVNRFCFLARKLLSTHQEISTFPKQNQLGATSMVYRADGWNSAVGAWLRSVLERRPVRLVTVALANKMARIARAVMTRKEVYRPKGGVAAVAQATA